MVDYQSACLTSPALDFLYLMITSASTSVWSQYEQLKDVYYDCLRLSMNKFQVNVTKCYARDCFEEDIKRFAPFAIYAAIYTSKTYFNIKSIIADEIDEEYSNRKCLYEKMLNNIFGYFVQYNII